MSAELKEARNLSGLTRDWIRSLQIAGVDNRSIAAAMQLALVEMVLAEGGKAGALLWLNGQIRLVEQYGDQLVIGRGS